MIFHVQIIGFDRVAQDVGAHDTLLGFALCTVNDEPLPALPVYRAHDRRLIVAWPITICDAPLPTRAAHVVAEAVERHVQGLERVA
ncbi:MAG: hypothetical protein JNL28_16280 [Planctomycetes bacterium]|nr:hypothetical protein [Planctomycetota bacterium]